MAAPEYARFTCTGASPHRCFMIPERLGHGVPKLKTKRAWLLCVRPGYQQLFTATCAPRSKSQPVRASVVRPGERARKLSSSFVSTIQCRRVMHDSAKTLPGPTLSLPCICEQCGMCAPTGKVLMRHAICFAYFCMCWLVQRTPVPNTLISAAMFSHIVQYLNCEACLPRLPTRRQSQNDVTRDENVLYTFLERQYAAL